MATRRLFPFALLSCLLASTAPAAQSSFAPPGWYSGDTHAHIQACPQCASCPDASLDSVYASMQANGLDLACVQLWNDTSDPSGAEYYANYAALVTGAEDPLTLADPDRALQIGLEVSGFLASQYGHVQGMGIQSGVIPNAVYPTPVLDFFRAQNPQALTGYAHVRWWDDYAPHTGLQVQHIGSSMAPMDLALGKFDFLEASVFVPGLDVRGMQYKLLRAGLRVPLVGGSDNGCLQTNIGDIRTYARIESGPFGFDAWTEAVKAGRTSIALGSERFLDLEVDGVGIGGQLELAPGPVNVVATLHAEPGAPQNGRIRIVHDGDLVAAQVYSLPAGGSFSFSTTLQLSKSGWISAIETSGADVRAHTSPVYAVVDGQPIANALDAEYWADLGQDLIADIGLYSTGSDTQAVLDHLESAVAVFDALAALDNPLSAGVTRLGSSTPTCTGEPVAIGLRGQPQVGDPDFAWTCLHGAPNAPGVLLVGDTSTPAGFAAAGLTLYVDPLGPVFLSLPTSFHSGGYAQVDLVPPPAAAGLSFTAQFVGFSLELDCFGTFASDALTIAFAP